MAALLGRGEFVSPRGRATLLVAADRLTHEHLCAGHSAALRGTFVAHQMARLPSHRLMSSVSIAKVKALRKETGLGRVPLPD